ncbi:MAG: pirin family protein [Xanthobacteraceae bacterium]|nr:pirin family protein [Xanthobacteraceae bacterium]
MNTSEKQIVGVYSNPHQHWVGDGFPVRPVFSQRTLGNRVSPFLLLDYAGPAVFEPSPEPRGVGLHPHKGFETVTIVYDGEVAHRDSTGTGGVIGPGDVQWMTAAAGILHEEFHSPSFSRTGGPFRMVQLWVNLPAKDKSAVPHYQSIQNADIPVVDLPDGMGRVRVIAGVFQGRKGPARTFTPVNLWDLRLQPGAYTTLAVPSGHTAMLVVLSGGITVNKRQSVREAEMILFERDGDSIAIDAAENAIVLVLTGQPIDEPVAWQGPFVMNSEAEIERAMADFESGRFGAINAGA